MVRVTIRTGTLYPNRPNPFDDRRVLVDKLVLFQGDVLEVAVNEEEDKDRDGPDKANALPTDLIQAFEN
jgi:hypothetical protein